MEISIEVAELLNSVRDIIVGTLSDAAKLHAMEAHVRLLRQLKGIEVVTYVYEYSKTFLVVKQATEIGLFKFEVTKTVITSGGYKHEKYVLADAYTAYV